MFSLFGYHSASIFSRGVPPCIWWEPRTKMHSEDFHVLCIIISSGCSLLPDLLLLAVGINVLKRVVRNRAAFHPVISKHITVNLWRKIEKHEHFCVFRHRVSEHEIHFIQPEEGAQESSAKPISSTKGNVTMQTVKSVDLQDVINSVEKALQRQVNQNDLNVLSSYCFFYGYWRKLFSLCSRCGKTLRWKTWMMFL